MSVKSAATYLWGSIVGMGIVWLLGFLTLSAVIGATFTWGVLFMLSVLWDEWRYPVFTEQSGTYTYRMGGQ